MKLYVYTLPDVIHTLAKCDYLCTHVGDVTNVESGI